MKLIKTKKFHFMLMVTFLLAVGCIPAPMSEVPSAGTPLPTVAFDAIEPLVADPGYLKGCRKLNSSVYNEQVIYKEITPGKTNSAEVKNMLGDPMNVIIDLWLYSDFSISFEEDVVSLISVSGYIHPLPHLDEIIMTYGCPDVVFAYHLGTDEPSPEDVGTLGMTSFVYSHIGVEFVINHYPVKLSDGADGEGFFVPMSLHDYLFSIKDSFEYPDTIKLVSWDEAVKE